MEIDIGVPNTNATMKNRRSLAYVATTAPNYRPDLCRPIAVGGIGAAIETFIDGYGRNAGPVLTPSLFLQIISELVYWRYLAIFALLCAIVADHFHRRKISLEDFWGEKGLMVPSSTGPSRSHVWLGLALAVFAAAMGIAERTQSHYFLQDDNYSQFYPGIHYAMENIWSGHWVSWNPLQLLGSPLTDLGIYSLTYPITHICYLMAKHLLGDDTRLMDLFCWFHSVLRHSNVELPLH